MIENFDFLFPPWLIALSDNELLAKASMDFFNLYQFDIPPNFTTVNMY